MAEVGGEAVYLVNPYDVDELVDGLQRLLTDIRLREELSHRGRQHVSQFSWEQAAEATTAVYRQILPEAS